MEMDEYLNEEEWKNITEYLHVCMANASDSIDWQIHMSLHTNTVGKEMLGWGELGVATAEGIFLNNKHRYLLRLVPTRTSNETWLSNKAFMIMAKKRKGLTPKPPTKK